MMKTTRSIIAAFLVLLSPWSAAAKNDAASDFRERLTKIELEKGGHIGVAASNTGDGRYLQYRANEPFAMCSTFKLLLAAAVLSYSDKTSQNLDRFVQYGPADMLQYAPVTQKNLAQGKMTVADLSAAAIDYSDNTAANLLLKEIGGPKRLTQYIRSIGDMKSRLDRNEPNLNSNLPDDMRDTTTPSAMLSDIHQLLIENALSQKSREQLISWLMGNTTGAARLRAGMPAGWKIGDKTGTGDNGATNDVAIVWPIDGKPILIAVYYTGSKLTQGKRNNVIAEIGRIVSETFSSP